MSHFNVLFVFWVFSLLVFTVYALLTFEPKCLAALRTQAYTGQLLYWEGPCIILSPSQSTGPDIRL